MSRAAMPSLKSFSAAAINLWSAIRMIPRYKKSELVDRFLVHKLLLDKRRVDKRRVIDDCKESEDEHEEWRHIFPLVGQNWNMLLYQPESGSNGPEEACRSEKPKSVWWAWRTWSLVEIVLSGFAERKLFSWYEKKLPESSNIYANQLPCLPLLYSLSPILSPLLYLIILIMDLSGIIICKCIPDLRDTA